MKAWLRIPLAVLPLACLPACETLEIGETQQALTRANEFYVVAHMTNTLRSVQWAVQQGANGLEMDLKFKDDGTPLEFLHGGVCDCSCVPVKTSEHVCRVLGVDSSNSCGASAEARAMMAEIVSVRSDIALLIIDSKVKGSDPLSRQEAAGKKVIDMVKDDLFAKGYGGKVIISVGKLDAYQYLYYAAREVAEYPEIRDRVYFAVDENGKTREDAATTISKEIGLPWRNRAYGSGISACAVGDFEPAISTADMNEDRNVQALTYLWTIDSETSMDTYLKRVRPRAIITNIPSRLRRVALARGLTLARPDTPMTDVAREDVTGPFRSECDCDYHSGGCRISDPAPPGQACKCVYKPLWTCRGDVTNCKNAAGMDTRKCLFPDLGKESCLQGGGDCGGYK